MTDTMLGLDALATADKRDPKPKDPPPAPHRVPVSSRNLVAVTYDFMHQTLLVEFHRGGSYRYYGVPAAVYHALLDAPSKGKFFRHAIRNGYGHSRA